VVTNVVRDPGRHVPWLVVPHEDHALLARWPDDARSWFNRGFVLEELGRLDDAQRLLERAMAQSPDIKNVRTYLGLTYVEMGRLAEAESLLSRELEANPREPLVLMATGLLRFRQEDWAEAARLLADSRVVDFGVLLRLCEAQIRLGQPRQAQDTARVVAALASGKPEVTATLERLFERHGVPLEPEPSSPRHAP